MFNLAMLLDKMQHSRCIKIQEAL